MAFAWYQLLFSLIAGASDERVINDGILASVPQPLGLVQSEKAYTASPLDQYHLFPTNCIKRFNRAGNEQVLATQDGRDHRNEYVHNITNEGEKRQQNYGS